MKNAENVRSCPQRDSTNAKGMRERRVPFSREVVKRQAEARTCLKQSCTETT